MQEKSRWGFGRLATNRISWFDETQDNEMEINNFDNGQNATDRLDNAAGTRASDPFPSGVSNDEDSDKDAFDRSFRSHRAQYKAKAKTGALYSKSKRTSGHNKDGNDESYDIYKPKRKKKSSSGGHQAVLFNQSDNDEEKLHKASLIQYSALSGDGYHFDDLNEDPKTPSYAIRGRLSSLNLEEEIEGYDDAPPPHYQMGFQKSVNPFGLADEDIYGTHSAVSSSQSETSDFLPAEIRRELKSVSVSANYPQSLINLEDPVYLTTCMSYKRVVDYHQKRISDSC
jgi:hypothetical protein